jgi:hypothetical protein
MFIFNNPRTFLTRFFHFRFVYLRYERYVFLGAGFWPAEWIKGTLTIQTKVYMKKTIASIKT